MFYLLFAPVVKILSKHHIVKEKKVPYVKREREVLMKINHPFFVKLYFTFQDKENLCILDNQYFDFVHMCNRTSELLLLLWVADLCFTSGFLIRVLPH